MNKSLLVGLVGGIGIATAGGVAGYALMSKPAEMPGSAEVMPEAGPASAEVMPAASVPTNAASAAPATAARAEARPAPQPTASAPTQRTAAAAPQPAAAPEPAVECWDEVVEVQAEPRDQRAIAGTASGAILGGAIAKKLGDDNDLLTAAGAAAGAFAGRRLQREVQANNTTETVERRCAPVQ